MSHDLKSCLLDWCVKISSEKSILYWFIPVASNKFEDILKFFVVSGRLIFLFNASLKKIHLEPFLFDNIKIFWFFERFNCFLETDLTMKSLYLFHISTCCPYFWKYYIAYIQLIVLIYPLPMITDVLSSSAILPRTLHCFIEFHLFWRFLVSVYISERVISILHIPFEST
jgi:hypothetical protein